MDEARLRAMFAVVDDMAWHRLPEFFRTDIVYERPGFPTLRGLDRVLRFYREERKIVRSVHRVEAAVAADGRAAAWGRVECELTDGSREDLGFADVYLVDRGLITLRRTHFFVPAV